MLSVPELEAIVNDALRKHGVPSASVAVLAGSQTLTAARGVMDVRTGALVGRDSIYEIRSVSKLFAAAITLKLHDAALFKLSDPAVSILARGGHVLSDRAGAIAATHLLSHSSARLRLLDSIGVAIAGVTAAPSKAIIEAGQQLVGSGPCHVFGSDVKLAPAGAALVNGALIHTLDFDDTYLAGSIHPSAAVTGASLAAVDVTGGTVGDLLRGIAVGTEVACWLSEVSPGELHDRGFLPTAVLGAVSGAVAARTIFGLDDKRFADATGLASAVAAGFFQLEDSWVKNWNGGWAANAGISAAITARVGYNGPLYALEGPRGLFAVHTKVKGIDASTLEPRGSWRSGSIALKRYSCCHFLHSTIDCALELGAKINLDKIEKIVVSLPPLAVKSVTTPDDIRAYPINDYRARFAGHWLLSRALTDGKITLGTFDDYAADRPDVVRLVDRMELRVHDFPNFPRDWPSRIDIRNRHGSTLTAYRDGEPVAVGPSNEDVIMDKFAANLSFAELGNNTTQLFQGVSTDATRPAKDLWQASKSV